MESCDTCIGTLGGATDLVNGTVQCLEFTGSDEIQIAVLFLYVIGHAFHDAPFLALLDGDRNLLLICCVFVCSLCRLACCHLDPFL